MRLLLIDDDTELCSLLSEFLKSEGFPVECVHEGRRGLERALHGGFSLVILDVMLPGMDGFEILRQLRKESRVPVLMLPARADDVDRIVGLELGADDYLVKPTRGNWWLVCAPFSGATSRARPLARAWK